MTAPLKARSGRTRVIARGLKRVFDIIAVLLAMPVWVPVGAVVALNVRMKLGRPVLFTQIRPGLHGRCFKMFKFRSMTNSTRPDGKLLPDADRLSAFGRWLRSTSLDELPELVNVLRGDMSLVGPRPLLMEYLPLYTPTQARRHDVRPGITGAAQVNGRNAISWEEKFAWDVWYVDHLSLWLDISILARTIFRVVARHGVSAAGDATMPKFSGTSTTLDRQRS